MFYQKRFAEKDATLKRFEYSPLGGELKKHTGIAKNHNTKKMLMITTKKVVIIEKNDISYKSNLLKGLMQY